MSDTKRTTERRPVPDQPQGTIDHTFPTRDPYPRDIDEEMGRNPHPDPPDLTIVVPGKSPSKQRSGA